MQPPYSSRHGTVTGSTQPVHAQREHPQRVALLPPEPRRRVLGGPDELRRDRVELLGSVIVATPTTSAQPCDRDRLADRRGVGEVDPVAVRRLHELGLLVLDGRVEPEPRRLHGEVAAVLADPALAHVEDLLAREQRVHDDRPLLERRCHRVHNRRRMDDTHPVG